MSALRAVITGINPEFCATGCWEASDDNVLSRVTTLKTLCEMRLDCQDLVNLVDECGKVGRSAKANAAAAANAKRKGPPLPEYINLRPAPLGTSGKGHNFWLLDLHTLQGDHGCSMTFGSPCEVLVKHVVEGDEISQCMAGPCQSQFMQEVVSISNKSYQECCTVSQA